MSHIHCTTMGNLVKSLTTGGTALEIADRTGLNICTVMRYLRVWHRLGVVYRADWQRGTGKNAKHSAVWRIGNKPDAVKPAPMTNNERCAVYKERQRLKREIEIKLERVRGMV